MHYPANIPLGESFVPIHFICETLAYFLGYRYYIYLRSKQEDQISDEHRILIFIGAALGGFLGSHILGVLENPQYLKNMGILYFMRNTTIVGGLLGGLIGVELIKKKIGVSLSSGDMMVYPIILAMILGRLGCHFAGLDDGTYGIPSSLPWAIDFGDGITRHPTNLYEIIFWILLWISLYNLEKQYALENGARFKLMLASYLFFRFCIEFIKPDYVFNFGLSVIQLACIAGLLYYYKLFANPSKLLKSYA
ncbi:prolipoprotein diacylglyceryl transferase [Pedobacter nutrimenti]|uniref:prolipoprotein diacylglyceryl transferase n=1 Tax=Pedobacter nutrimenti TaxID=1241337 RepID=UPI00293110AE|nr:prolipoprotein diacylglyceryl transferase family protein [Pedobacter nutrimenti]